VVLVICTNLAIVNGAPHCKVFPFLVDVSVFEVMQPEFFIHQHAWQWKQQLHHSESLPGYLVDGCGEFGAAETPPVKKKKSDFRRWCLPPVIR